MKTYVKFTAEEMDRITEALCKNPNRAIFQLGKRIKQAVGRHAPCDMELIGQDDKELADEA